MIGQHEHRWVYDADLWWCELCQMERTPVVTYILENTDGPRDTWSAYADGDVLPSYCGHRHTTWAAAEKCERRTWPEGRRER